MSKIILTIDAVPVKLSTSFSAEIMKLYELYNGWRSSKPLPETIGHSQSVVINNKIYILGGYIEGNWSSKIYTTDIKIDGALGQWILSGTLPEGIGESHAIVTKNRLYLLGGYNGHGDGLSNIYMTPIHTDGTLGEWSNGFSLPTTVSRSHVVVTKNRVYLLGGYIDGTWSSTVFTSNITEDGVLGNWKTSSSLPGNIGYSQVIMTKNRVYLLGGYVNGYYSSIVYTAPISEHGELGNWSTWISLPVNIGWSRAVVTKNRVYLLGGLINNDWSTIVYTAPINKNGILGEWETSEPLPKLISNSQAIVTKNRVYLLGGHDGNSYTSSVCTGLLNDKGEILEWFVSQ